MSEKKVRYFVSIRNNETGETRVHIFDMPIENKQISDINDTVIFLWSEGNYSCDCNRSLEFERVEGYEPTDEETPCGSGKYSVTVKQLITQVIYDEM